jgi:hypothetical protein
MATYIKSSVYMEEIEIGPFRGWGMEMWDDFSPE